MAAEWKSSAIEAIEHALSDLDFISGDEEFNSAIGCAIADLTKQLDRLRREVDGPRATKRKAIQPQARSRGTGLPPCRRCGGYVGSVAGCLKCAPAAPKGENDGQ